MKKILMLMGAAVAALALVAAFSSCKKDNPVEPEPEQPELDFSKLVMKNTKWTIEEYSALGINVSSSMWSHGGDEHILGMLKDGDTVTLYFKENGICSILEYEVINASYGWDPKKGVLYIGYDEIYNKSGKPKFSVDGKYVVMDWKSENSGKYHTFFKARIEKDKLTFK